MNKKILASIFVIGILAFAMGWGTYSYFSDTEKSVGNVFTAGTIDITVTGDGYTWSTGAVLAGLKPCETGWIRFTINNPGDNPVDVWKHLKVTGLGGGTLTDSEYEEGLCTFATSGDGVAGWSAVGQGHSGDYSVELYTSGGELSYGAVNIPIVPILLQSLGTDPSYWVYEPTVVTDRHPYVNIILDLDGDLATTGDIDCLEGVVSRTIAGVQPTAATWTEMKEAVGYYGIDGFNMANSKTFAQWLTYMAAHHADAKVIRVQIRFGNWGDPAGSIGPVYVDDITIKGVTYDLEPDLYFENCDIDNVITYDLWTSKLGWIIEEINDVRVSDIDCYWIYLGTIPAGGSMYVQQSYHMQAEVGNWAQGDKMTFDIEIFAEQLGGPGPKTIWP
jgi:predicted ribosomally synthesized peptide with SipW-like signal peptide